MPAILLINVTRFAPAARIKEIHVIPRVLLARLLMLLVLLSSASALAGSTAAGQPAQNYLPQISLASTNVVIPGEVNVLGANFTPGGSVFIAVYDRWGESALETRWTVASEDTLAIDNTSNPDRGFHPGGVVFETFTFADLADAPGTAAQDHTSVAGRDDIEAFPVNTTVPFDHDCTGSAMIRAFDRQSGSWSNLLDIDINCQS
jgi:hypothetical protein